MNTTLLKSVLLSKEKASESHTFSLLRITALLQWVALSIFIVSYGAALWYCMEYHPSYLKALIPSGLIIALLLLVRIQTTFSKTQ